MSTINILLTQELKNFVESQVKSGHFLTTSEVICAALRLLIEQEELKNQRRQELRKMLCVGQDEFKRGVGVPAEEAHVELDQRRAKQRVILLQSDPTANF